jgi:hypothetical protein
MIQTLWPFFASEFAIMLNKYSPPPLVVERNCVIRRIFNLFYLQSILYHFSDYSHKFCGNVVSWFFNLTIFLMHSFWII